MPERILSPFCWGLVMGVAAVGGLAIDHGVRDRIASVRGGSHPMLWPAGLRNRAAADHAPIAHVKRTEPRPGRRSSTLDMRPSFLVVIGCRFALQEVRIAPRNAARQTAEGEERRRVQ
jgi:hypothetical protein